MIILVGKLAFLNIRYNWYIATKQKLPRKLKKKEVGTRSTRKYDRKHCTLGNGFREQIRDESRFPITFDILEEALIKLSEL